MSHYAHAIHGCVSTDLAMQHLLIDTISPEHEFDIEFFAKMDLFAAIFEKTLAVYQVRVLSNRVSMLCGV